MFHYSSHSSPSSQNLSTSASSSNHNNNKRKHATISSSSSSSSSSSNMMETNNDLSITTAEQKQQQIEELMQCNQCQGTFYQPITTHCGHVYCRLCLLKLKLNGEACPSCQCALPRYNFVQNQAAQNRILIRLFKLMDQLQQSTSSTNNRITKIAQRQQRSIPYNMIAIPMFVTGVVILPRQHTRIPIYMPNHIRMLRQAAFASQQYDGLCLPAVHRGRPNLSQYGTLVEIVSVEHYLNNDGSTSFTIEVCGRERFCTHCTDYEERNMEDLSVLISDIDIVPEITPAFNNKNDNNNSGISTTHAIASSSNHNSPMSSRGGVFDTTLQHQTRIEELALQVYMFIEEIAAAPPLENISNNVHTSTVGLLGPFWFETMERIHGKLPSRYEPAALIWWTATILPVSGAERYALLRTINLQDRLELVLSWIKQLDGQWKRWRQTAVNAVAAAIQPQLEK
ncbi:ATP-dependent protease La domain-containing protein [Phascolomyces articulosus]|uniref:ATP-dependent protease La domain-containing protein n=1 Tax=Phascolomyces articulosus TaxID=60185 RepID=A0AAD5KFW7_9FUNG|nr:ATP-dependent protease La domain-containing protein [Phascolomyces articulosus]